MSYTVLYRKYRPKNFGEIVGQGNIVEILKNQIITDKISHAYLFTGIRGTGKTSAAKVFAKSINCFNPVNGEACGTCSFCLNYNLGAVSDIVEIDAASNRGIDEIRDLREKVNYMPSLGKYRVYIIDEVHMLTTEAFNALLKTLEEPPSHVVFIFATTEPNKIPQTILSRCQRFDFGRIPKEVIIKQLQKILDENNVLYSKEALNLIANASEGALRDALSILDKAITLKEDGKIDEKIACEVLGLANKASLYLLIESIINNESAKAIELGEALINEGTEISVILDQLIEEFRNILLLIHLKGDLSVISKDNASIELLRKIASEANGDRVSELIISLASLKSELKALGFPKYLFEARLVQLSSQKENATREDALNSNDSFIVEDLTNKIALLKEELDNLKEGNFVNNLPKTDNSHNKIEKEAVPIKEQVKEKINSNKSAPKDLKEVQKLVYDCGIFVGNKYREVFVSEGIKQFKVIDFIDDILTIYPNNYVTSMDMFDETFDGTNLFKKTLKEKLGKEIEIKYENSYRQVKTPKLDESKEAPSSKEQLEEVFGELTEIDD